MCYKLKEMRSFFINILQLLYLIYFKEGSKCCDVDEIYHNDGIQIELKCLM